MKITLKNPFKKEDLKSEQEVEPVEHVEPAKPKVWDYSKEVQELTANPDTEVPFASICIFKDNKFSEQKVALVNNNGLVIILDGKNSGRIANFTNVYYRNFVVGVDNNDVIMETCNKLYTRINFSKYVRTDTNNRERKGMFFYYSTRNEERLAISPEKQSSIIGNLLGNDEFRYIIGNAKFDAFNKLGFAKVSDILIWVNILDLKYKQKIDKRISEWANEINNEIAVIKEEEETAATKLKNEKIHTDYYSHFRLPTETQQPQTAEL